jgi:hypothetical protein
VNEAFVDWYQWKLFAQQSGGVSMDALHVILGVVIQLGAAALFRKSVDRLGPWLVVLAVELANELNDLLVEVWPDPGMQYGEAVKDVVLTMLLPTIILVAARLTPQLLIAEGRAEWPTDRVERGPALDQESAGDTPHPRG